jgi:hypothetical protein
VECARPSWVNSVSSLLAANHHSERAANIRLVLISAEFVAVAVSVSAYSYLAASWCLTIPGVDTGANTTVPLSRDGTLLHHTADTYLSNGSTPTPLDQMKSALRVFIMNFKYGPGLRGGESNATVLCRIVDRAADLPNSTNPPEASATSSAGSIGGSRSMIVLWGIAMVSVLAVL